MIGRLTGRYEPLDQGTALIDVGGVGYLVFASSRALSAWDQAARGSATAEVSALIETHVREDHIHLYGFTDAAERAWFRLLLAVQGVGAKVALAVLSVLDTDSLHRAIAAGDKATIARADGVGPKLAARIASELKDKVPKLPVAPAGGRGAIAVASPMVDPAAASLAEDCVSALSNLGFAPLEAGRVVARLLADQPEMRFDALMRAALKELSPR